MRRSVIVATSLVLLAAPLVVSCSKDSDKASGTTSEATTTAEATTPTSAGSSGSSEVLPPIFITEAGEQAVKVGDALDVTTEGVTRVSTDNPLVLEVSQPYSDGSATFNAGGKVLAPGTAVLTVYGEDDAELYQVTLTATK